ncbi:MAG: hypothetical protein LBV32_05030 [Tannerellaceae bacterium]|jgi:hypothetical protein|nr:hypothetical protein [Tannerellaceae bacterium]
MKPETLLRAILPDVLIDNFDIVNFEKSDNRFDIWLDEKKVRLREDKYISYKWDLSEHDHTRLNAEFVAFLKEGD